MNLKVLFSRPAAWWTVAGVLGVVLCAAAVSNAVYDLTSPPAFDFHVLLRKLYSIIAFTAVGYPVARARLLAGRSASLLLIGAVIAGYSAVIEVLQYFVEQPWEGIVWNTIDVACGMFGGSVAALLARPRSSR